jgi:hypothetical protein
LYRRRTNRWRDRGIGRATHRGIREYDAVAVGIADKKVKILRRWCDNIRIQASDEFNFILNDSVAQMPSDER